MRILSLKDYNETFVDHIPEVQGCNQFHLEDQSCIISIKEETIQPFEKVLLHELVHLVLADLDMVMGSIIGENEALQQITERYIEKSVMSLTDTLLEMDK